MTQPKFIYFVNFDDFLVCHNLGFTNHLTSSSIAHWETYKEEHPIYTIAPERLISDINALQTFLTPRLTYILLACWHRQGLKIGVGQINAKYYTQEQVDKILRLAELEIEFEKVRRQVNIDLPSRLMCIFLAEDNIDGRVMLQNMFFNRTNFCIAPIEIIHTLRFHRADSKWVEIYEETKDIKAIQNYWEGICSDSNPQFEYLLDGQIRLANLEDKECILNDYLLRHVPNMKYGS